MNALFKTVLSISLALSINSFGLEKPETADVNAETKALAADFKKKSTLQKGIQSLWSGSPSKTNTTDADMAQLKSIFNELTAKTEHISSTLKAGQLTLKKKFKQELESFKKYFENVSLKVK